MCDLDSFVSLQKKKKKTVFETLLCDSQNTKYKILKKRKILFKRIV